MSTKITVNRICQYCGKEFIAQKTTTRYCSMTCNRRDYKEKVRNQKVARTNKETKEVKTNHLEDIKAKEFLTVKDMALLLDCSVRSVYYYIESGKLAAVNLGQRITRIKRSHVDKLFDELPIPEPVPEPDPFQYDINECYGLTEIQIKYGISDKALYELIKRNSILKIKIGRYTYVPKVAIDKILG